LSPEDKDLIWRYRFSLNTFKRSLTKFLKSVTWSDDAEARQAVEVLLPLWTEVGIDDALELLGPGSEDGRVRAFAVKQMARADDEVSISSTHGDSDLVNTTPMLTRYRFTSVGAATIPVTTGPSAQIRGEAVFLQRRCFDIECSTTAIATCFFEQISIAISG
jgi:hypothetical protein